MDATTFRAKLEERKRRKAALACVEKLAQLLKCDANPEAVLQAVEKLQDTKPEIDIPAAFDLVINTIAPFFKGEDGAQQLAELVQMKALFSVLDADILALITTAKPGDKSGERLVSMLVERGYPICLRCAMPNPKGAKECWNCGTILSPQTLDIPSFLTPWKCNVCGVENRWDAEKCVECGKPKGTLAPGTIVVEMPMVAPMAPPKPVAPLPPPPPRVPLSVTVSPAARGAGQSHNGATRVVTLAPSVSNMDDKTLCRHCGAEVKPSDEVCWQCHEPLSQAPARRNQPAPKSVDDEFS